MESLLLPENKAKLVDILTCAICSVARVARSRGRRLTLDSPDHVLKGKTLARHVANAPTMPTLNGIKITARLQTAGGSGRPWRMARTRHARRSRSVSRAPATASARAAAQVDTKSIKGAWVGRGDERSV